MKASRFVVPMLVFLIAGVARADSIPILTVTQADAGAGPNNGGGDNAGLVLSGPGFLLSAFGGTGSYGFIGDTFSQGDSVGGFGIDWSGFYLTIGKTIYDPDTIDLSLVLASPLSALSVPGGCVPAELINGNNSGVPIHLSASAGDNFVEFNLVIPRGTLCVNFDQVADSPSLYEFSSATFSATSTVPEPSTLALMATGLGVYFGLARRKRRCGCSSTC